MQINFEGKIRETDRCKGAWVNTITVKRRDGKVVVLDRNITNTVKEEDGKLYMVWKNVYIWDGKRENYICGEDAELFAGVNYPRLKSGACKSSG